MLIKSNERIQLKINDRRMLLINTKNAVLVMGKKIARMRSKMKNMLKSKMAVENSRLERKLDRMRAKEAKIEDRAAVKVGRLRDELYDLKKFRHKHANIPSFNPGPRSILICITKQPTPQQRQQMMTPSPRMSLIPCPAAVVAVNGRTVRVKVRVKQKGSARKVM